MNTTSLLQFWAKPSSMRVKYRAHLALDWVAHGSSVKGNSARSASKSHCGVGHSSVAEENRVFNDGLRIPRDYASGCLRHQDWGRVRSGFLGFRHLDQVYRWRLVYSAAARLRRANSSMSFCRVASAKEPLCSSSD